MILDLDFDGVSGSRRKRHIRSYISSIGYVYTVYRDLYSIETAILFIHMSREKSTEWDDVGAGRHFHFDSIIIRSSSFFGESAQHLQHNTQSMIYLLQDTHVRRTHCGAP